MLLLCMLWGMLSLSAQTDMTSKITNPSFESDFNGWEQSGLGRQNNNVFSIKAGTYYAEKWTGRGGAVGTAHAHQTLTSLPPGNYELTVAAQNIQEDTPTAKQTGAWIFAGNEKTTVTVRDNYKVAFTHVTGSVTIGFEAVNASGNWIAVDNFRLSLVGSDLSKPLADAIAQATATYGDGTGKQAAQLLTAINAAKDVANNSNATAQEQADAIIALQQAEEIFLRANATENNPLDLTSLIVNPSFETGDFTGWKATSMSTQGNSAFNIKNGTYYVEKWTGKGGAVGNAQLSQIVTGMEPGHYRLKATAQNIQEDTPKASQTGAWIYANTHLQAVDVRQDYTLDFVLVSSQLEIGFLAKSASGNWIAVDNFRLEYVGDDFDAVKTEFSRLIAQAEQLAAKKMNAAAAQALQAAIDAAKPLLSQSTADGWGEAARNLEAAYTVGEASQEVFARLATAIADAQTELNQSAAANKADYQTAINQAQAVYDSTSTSDDQAAATIEMLQKAAFEFKIANGSAQGPKVTTDSRFIRGCTWAFGRSTVTGSNILEQGFCWAENPDPKVTDHRTTEYINQSGRIYWLRDLKPATIYYMRAYAINKDYGVGYGDVIKFVTVPKGTVGHWYNNGGDEATNDRINYAIDTAIDYYWNNLTSIHDFGISVNYSPGTPTADCSYGGWMRVGASSSYQQPGTIMHEAFHGIGVGTHDIWWSGEMRSAGNRGDWLGDRVTEAVRFWDNSTTAVITGDDMHLWPYGCNGAHEDTHNDNLYCMMGILAQALNEDGLPASGNIGYALPYYSFNQEDGVKYYLKNEDAERGLYTSYLVENDNHQLEWKVMSASDATADDHAAWYLSFTPKNQYYQLRNAATGSYITYSSGFKTASHATPTAADNLHLMRGRVDVKGHRGYYIIHPQSGTATPSLLNALTGGKTGSAGFNISKKATTQRWLILTADEAQDFEKSTIDISRKELQKVLAQIRLLAQTPHTETLEGTDQTLATTLDAIETQGNATTSVSELATLVEQARQAGMTFLNNVAASNVENPFNLTFLMQNPDFAKDAVTGWTSASDPGYGGGAAEFYERTFDFYQTLTGMPAGIYQLRANAFQRPGETAAVFTQYTAGNRNISTELYLSSASTPVMHICDDRQPKALYTGDGADKKLSDGTYVPITMNGAAAFFAKGLYDNSVTMEQATPNVTLRMGIRGTKSATYYWSIFDNFRLLFFGQNHVPLGISETECQTTGDDSPCYDLQGRRLTTGSTLSKGLYITRNGRKVLVK